jgi:hypothetical protein
MQRGRAVLSLPHGCPRHPLHHQLDGGALNAKLRRAVCARGHFPADKVAMKLILNRSETAWKMGPRE